ncbi:MAG: hypothetical protein K0S20_495 [Patescibacteria group bacterium]|jgi:hypothetical protein|nr:hypothetical protein [Patescibacteria group bacterium]
MQIVPKYCNGFSPGCISWKELSLFEEAVSLETCPPQEFSPIAVIDKNDGQVTLFFRPDAYARYDISTKEMRAVWGTYEEGFSQLLMTHGGFVSYQEDLLSQPIDGSQELYRLKFDCNGNLELTCYEVEIGNNQAFWLWQLLYLVTRLEESERLKASFYDHHGDLCRLISLSLESIESIELWEEYHLANTGNPAVLEVLDPQEALWESIPEPLVTKETSLLPGDHRGYKTKDCWVATEMLLEAAKRLRSLYHCLAVAALTLQEREEVFLKRGE